MNLYIYNLEGTLYEGDASVVTMPADDGEISVLENHAPLTTSLKKGMIRFKTGAGSREFAIEKGFAYIDGKNLIVLSD